MLRNCPNIIASGSCTNTGCVFNHNILTCDPCGYVARNIHEYQAHLQSKKHQRVLAGKIEQTWYCHICERPIGSNSWNQHKNGKRHRDKAKSEKLDVNLEPDPVVPANTHTFCTICQSSITTRYWDSHIRSRSHLKKEQYVSFKNVLDEAEKEKNGVTIQGEAELGVLEPAIAAVGKTTTLKISSTVPSAKIVLVSVKLSADLGAQKRKRVVLPLVLSLCRLFI